MFFIGAKKWPGISKLIEECGEVMQVCGKLMGSQGEIQHWDGTNLRDRLEEEMGDVLAAIGFVVDVCGLNWTKIQTRMMRKRKLFEKWHAETLQAPKLSEVSSTSLGCGSTATVKS